MRLKIFFEGGLNGEEVVNFWMGGWGGGGRVGVGSAGFLEIEIINFTS